MEKAKWLLKTFTLNELNELKEEITNLLTQYENSDFPLTREFLEKIRINLHSRTLHKEQITWRRWVRKEQTSQQHWEKEQDVGYTNLT